MTRIASSQAPKAVVMIRPHRFRPNPVTAKDNAFQRQDRSRKEAAIAKAAYDEVTNVAQKLEAEGVTVHLYEDEGASTPDSVFPNNWFSTHTGGHVAIYPMYAPNRQKERRFDIIEMLKTRYRVQDVIDYSGLEMDSVYLEGTGAMVLDHIDRVAYAVRSNRTDPVALERFCTHFNFEPMAFDAVDGRGKTIYHTNVLMCIGVEFAMVGLGLIPDAARRAEIRDRLAASGRDIIELTSLQIDEFAGNALELQGRNSRITALSARAFRALSDAQRDVIGRSGKLVPLDVPTIELAGGSIRCMLAGIHLSAR